MHRYHAEYTRLDLWVDAFLLSRDFLMTALAMTIQMAEKTAEFAMVIIPSKRESPAGCYFSIKGSLR